MGRLLFFHDFTSPFCRLGGQVALRVAERAGLELRAVPFELYPAPVPIPDTSDGAFAAELRDAEGVAKEWSLRLGRPGALPRTGKAHEAVAFAREEGAERPLLEAIYDALWERSADLSRLDVLAEIGESVGLDRDGLHVALGTDRHRDAVAREQNAAVDAGIEGVPAFQISDVVAVGLFPDDELLAWIEDNRDSA